MCGCPIEPGGQWDAERYDFDARQVPRIRKLLDQRLIRIARIFAGNLEHQPLHDLRRVPLLPRLHRLGIGGSGLLDVLLPFNDLMGEVADQ